MNDANERIYPPALPARSMQFEVTSKSRPSNPVSLDPSLRPFSFLAMAVAARPGSAPTHATCGSAASSNEVGAALARSPHFNIQIRSLMKGGKARAKEGRPLFLYICILENLRSPFSSALLGMDTHSLIGFSLPSSFR